MGALDATSADADLMASLVLFTSRFEGLCMSSFMCSNHTVSQPVHQCIVVYPWPSSTRAVLLMPSCWIDV